MCDVEEVKPLSVRVRAGSEAAPWVVDEILRLEQEISDLRGFIDGMRKPVLEAAAMYGVKP